MDQSIWKRLQVSRRLHVAVFFAIRIPLVAAATDMNGDDFSNNLFTDIGPILALFGEQVLTLSPTDLGVIEG